MKTKFLVKTFDNMWFYVQEKDYLRIERIWEVYGYNSYCTLNIPAWDMKDYEWVIDYNAIKEIKILFNWEDDVEYKEE